MSIYKNILLSTVFSFATYSMISNTYAIPHNDPDASHDQLISFAIPPHSPKIDDQESAKETS